MTKKKVFLDPGHGGHDPGAVGALSKEAHNVLQVALALEKKLIAAGYEVRLSRKTDMYLTLSQRATMANQWGADIFISLHDNSAVNKAATGFETFIFNGSVSARSIKLQQHVHGAIIKGIGLRDRGMKRANFAVLRETNMAALLIEYGFISNANDEKVIAYQIELQAHLTFVGINSFYGVQTVTPAPAPPKEEKTMKEIARETMKKEALKEVKAALKDGRFEANKHPDVDKYDADTLRDLAIVAMLRRK